MTGEPGEGGSSLLDQFDRAVIVAAHPDDETLGCGATVRAIANSGCRVDAIFMTDGVGARGTVSGATARRRACEAAAEHLGIATVQIMDFPDNRLDAVDLLDVVKTVEEHLEAKRPQLVLTHSSADLNVDHRIVHDAVVTATRPSAQSAPRLLLAFEVPSATEWRFDRPFRPQLFRDVSADWSAKLAALEEYSAELRDAPHPRSLDAINALGTLRGACVGAAKAEAFEVIRWIDRPGTHH